MRTNYSNQQLKDPLVARSEAILKKCVHCGLCTSTCSSYAILGDERASPRGRIYLINQMMKTDKKPSKSTIGFLDSCLTCLSCMTTCPSGVDYVHLIDMARARIGKTEKRALSHRVLRPVLANLLPYPKRMKAAMTLGKMALPLKPAFEKLGMTPVAGLLDSLPASAPGSNFEPLKKHIVPTGKITKRVAMLPGCTNDLIRPGINPAAQALLSRAGVEITIPSDLGCCGAIEHHLGEDEKALTSARRNIDVLTRLYNEPDFDAIFTTASGCGSMLKDYAHLLRNDEAYAERAQNITDLTRDVTEILVELDMPAPRQIKNIKVAYHSACSLQHGQRVIAPPRTLLKNAGFTVLEIPEGHLCCGSAGTYSILQPDISKALRSRKIDNIKKIKPDIIVAGNIGCINHMASETKTPFVHTVELLNWAYGGDCPAELRHLEEKKFIE